MEILVPLSPFVMVVLIVATVFYFNSKNKRAILETVREASRNGQPLDAETIKALGMPTNKSEGGDLKAGFVLIALAAAIVVTGVLVSGINGNDSDVLRGTLAGASFPGFIGIVLVLFGLAGARQRKQERELE